MTTILERYNRPAPRYTSYPPAPHWQAAGGDLLQHAVRDSSRPLSLYVHLPFCERLCLYCGCNVIVKKDHSLAAPYLEHLIAEMDLISEAHGRYVTQIHWGGGTPTYFDSDQIRILFNALASRFAVPWDAEISIEIDPRVTTREQLKTLRWLGFNRLSVGVQDFDPEVQSAIGRHQPFEMVQQLFDEARGTGFQSINVDLIYGLPHQNRYSYGHTLDLVDRLAPSRIALFSYAHVPAIKKQQTALTAALPSEQRKFELFQFAIERLKDAGYVQVGMDHFARPDDELTWAARNGSLHRNFQGYTTHAETDLLGFGVSAISHFGSTFTQNCKDLESYQAKVRAGKTPVARGYVMSEDDRIRAAVIESLLCRQSVTTTDIEREFGIVFDSYFAAELARLHEFQRDGLVEEFTSPILKVTPQGRVFIRTIAQVFDAFQPAPVASRAV